MAKTKELIWSVSKVSGIFAIVIVSLYGYVTVKKKRKMYAKPIRGFASLGGESGGV